jgi:hypothetical protein
LVKDDQHVGLLDPVAGREVWVRQTPTPSVSREPPQFLSDGKSLLLLIDGWQLERLDPLTGHPLAGWPRPIGSEPVALERAALDESAVYFVSRNTLHARSLADGKPLWKGLPLTGPPVPWRVVLSRSGLVVYPLQAQPRRPRSLVLGGYWVAFRPVVQSRFPLLLVDPREGKAFQTFAFDAEELLAAVQLSARGPVVGLGGKALCLGLAGREGNGVRR